MVLTLGGFGVIRYRHSGAPEGITRNLAEREVPKLTHSRIADKIPDRRFAASGMTTIMRSSPVSKCHSSPTPLIPLILDFDCSGKRCGRLYVAVHCAFRSPLICNPV